MSNLTELEIKKQSENCYQQWAPQWRQHAKYHGDRFDMHHLGELHNIGIGKACLLVANGYSFEEQIDTIKKYQDNVDIVCCDKTLGHCLDHGIIPTICVVCDANVSYETYMDKWKDKLKDTILISNVCGNPKWAANGNWKKIYFFINRDVLHSEEEFGAISGCPNFIVAGTNVSNAMLIVVTQCDEHGARNVFGYDKILLIGYDYSWVDNYYAFNKDGDGKANYMKSVFCRNHRGQFAFTSPNLAFSAKWVEQYIRTYQLNVIQCSKLGIVRANATTDDLASQMQYQYQVDDSQFVQKLVKIRNELKHELKNAEAKIINIMKDHKLHVLATIP